MCVYVCVALVKLIVRCAMTIFGLSLYVRLQYNTANFIREYSINMTHCVEMALPILFNANSGACINRM